MKMDISLIEYNNSSEDKVALTVYRLQWPEMNRVEDKWLFDGIHENDATQVEK